MFPSDNKCQRSSSTSTSRSAKSDHENDQRVRLERICGTRCTRTSSRAPSGRARPQVVVTSTSGRVRPMASTLLNVWPRGTSLSSFQTSFRWWALSRPYPLEHPRMSRFHRCWRISHQGGGTPCATESDDGSRDRFRDPRPGCCLGSTRRTLARRNSSGS